MFGRSGKTEFRCREAPYQQQGDGREAASFWSGIQGQGGLAAAKGYRTTAQLASQFGIHTSQVTLVQLPARRIHPGVRADSGYIDASPRTA